MQTTLPSTTVTVLIALGFLASRLPAQEFSGPQPGEKVTSFAVRGVLGPHEGAEFDPVKLAGGKPLVLVFVSDVTRPSVGLSRLLLGYAAGKRKDGLHAALVFLSADATSMEATIRRASHALPRGVPVGISTEGAEGPGAYGLNRNVAMTVIVAKEGKVTANFALVQPSIAADAPKIAAAIAESIGATPPSLEELERAGGPMRRRE